MARGIGVWARVGGKVADTVLAPDGHNVGALLLGDRLGSVVAEGSNTGGEVGKEPRGNLLVVVVSLTEEADGGEPGVKALGERLDGDGAGGVNDDEVLDALAGLGELVDNLIGDDTARGPTSQGVGTFGLSRLHSLNELGSHTVDTALVLLRGLHEGGEETPDRPLAGDLADLGVGGCAATAVGYHPQVLGGGAGASLEKDRGGLAVRVIVNDLSGRGLGLWANTEGLLNLQQRGVGDEEVAGNVHARLLAEGAENRETHERVHAQSSQIWSRNNLINLNAHLRSDSVTKNVLEVTAFGVVAVTLDGTVTLLVRGSDVGVRLQLGCLGNGTAGITRVLDVAVLAIRGLELSKESLECTDGRVLDKGMRVDVDVKLLTHSARDGQSHQGVTAQISEGDVVSKFILGDTNFFGQDVENVLDNGALGELGVDSLEVAGGDLLGSLLLATLLLGRGSLGGGSSLGGSGGRSRAGSGTSTRRQDHVEDLARDGLELDVASNTDDAVTIKDVSITSHHLGTLDRLHTNVGAVSLGGIELLGESHGAPSVGDEDLLARVDGIGTVDDETREMATAVNPVRVAEKAAILLRGLETDLGGSLAGLAVQDDLLHTLVLLVIVDQSSEELVGQSATNLGRLALSLSLLEGVNTALDEVANTLELVSPLLSAAVDDLAVSVLGLLRALASVEADVGIAQSDVGSDGGAEDMGIKLLVKDESLGHLDVGNVQADGLGVRAEHLVRVVGNSHSHIGVEGGRAERSAVAQVALDERAGVGAREVGLGLDEGNVTIDILVSDCVDGGGGQLRPGRLDLERSLDRGRTTVLGKAPIAGVLEPVVLLVEGVGREVKETSALAEVAVELIPVQVDTSSVKSTQSVAENLVSRLVATQSGNSNRADAKRRLDEVGTDGVRSNLEPNGLLVNGTRLLGVDKAAKEVDSVTGVVAKVRGIDRLVLNHLAKQRRDDGNLRPLEAHGTSESLKVVQDGIDLSRVEGERHLELGALETGSAKMRGDLTDLGSRTAENSLPRAVDASNVDSLSLGAEGLHDRVNGAGDSEHSMGASSALLDEELGASSN
ncbi:uncharacterized protein ColSpa_05297 [Colletotrichum spaethianum]|uniref:Uncharacterized protein n=1 Tax=Colletotrichum spaethianum TaxID=700344 RepID=A0AA37LJD0_9PEZI|nr:uncharacterized protein ColSpa_05297 [Colletotrichum spaethianum]GKT45117.1 hypothetical protein ColSpa_05297 [Colletotrichum spaethianum]